MDPSIWGPLAWDIIFDICWLLEKSSPSVLAAAASTTTKEANDDNPIKKSNRNYLRTRQLDARMCHAVWVFFQSMRWLLPCEQCRTSYKRYLARMGGVPPPCDQNVGCCVDVKHLNRRQGQRGSDRSPLRWAYDLRNMVNRKLHKKDIPPYETVYRRMETWTSVSSAANVWDFLYVLTLHYGSSSSRSSGLFAKQKEYLFRLLRTLPYLLGVMPNHMSVAYALRKNPVQMRDLKDTGCLLRYLCAASKTEKDSLGTILRLKKKDECVSDIAQLVVNQVKSMPVSSPEDALSKYAHCRALNKYGGCSATATSNGSAMSCT